ncbi:DUF4166 domain-containing protein [Hyalangium rubrum]|uniref:DUF4166 domain-containing protein n=1 Tax=Hyalangium rubrum TaxID=3103134 RepID=A0ABU5GZK8_9BACT|nr:DUF4166 domain-containing protein [Hyalangium sp. s54d21]MDY7226471.1 DUF4166 domain-containing protein [Hyalangium sp. s54d21]
MLTSVPAPSLYAGMLGAHWETLPPLVRRMHEEGSATGRFVIRRGEGALSALVGWLCRFPAPGEDVPTRLSVRRERDTQCWERTFGGHALSTVQRAWEGGRMGERFGPVECVFQLSAVEGGLAYEQVGAWLCLGPWRLRMPRVLAPRVEGLATEAPGGMRVRVRIGTAFTDWLLTYEGLVRPEEQAS